MEDKKKLRVVLLCHFSWQSIRDKMPLTTFTVENLFRKIIGLKQLRYVDRGLWNLNIIESLEREKEIELHVIAPHVGLKKKVLEFSLDNTTFHFYRPELPFPLYFFERTFYKKQYKEFPRTRETVKKLIKEIDPDIVNLIGAENPYYSITALDIEDIPVILHCQTVYANPDRKLKSGIVNKYRWDLEIELFRKIKYIACTGRMYYDLIKGYAPNAVLFPRTWPAAKFPEINEQPKKYDFAYWARSLNKKKGFDSAIEAIGIVARKHPDIKVIAVGSWDGDKKLYEQRIKELGIEKNIEIHPSFPDYTEMLQYVKQAKFALLPIKMDVLSGTILEAMRMGMPVVTCRTSGTPSLNEKRDTVLISDIGDNAALAQHMIELLDNAELVGSLKSNAEVYITELDEKNAHNIDTMVAQYKAVISHYRNETPIPQELLYNIKENIDYRNNENKKNNN